MKIISLWRPWGAAVVSGLKRIETRAHRNFRGLARLRIGIHNTVKWDSAALPIMRLSLPACLDPGILPDLNPKLHPAMAIIGTVRVDEFRELTAADEGDALCPIWDNKWGLILSEPKHLREPIFVPGAMGIWEYDLEGRL